MRTRAAVAPAPSSALGRVTGTLHEPNAWTVGILLATGVVLLARHPIAHLLGTEVDVSTPAVATSQAPAAPRPSAFAPSLSLPVAAAPTHAPRDPFRALVTAGGRVLAPETATVPTPAAAGAPAAAVAPPATPAAHAASASCAGTTHRVVAGDTLWTIAARAVRTPDSGRVTLAWHRIYAANRGVLGSDPALLQIGESLCVPTSI